MTDTLTSEEINNLIKAKEIFYTVTKPVNPILQRFCDEYENDETREIKPNDKIRYFFSKRNYTLGEAEEIMGLPGGSISASAHQKSEKVDTFLSLITDIPINELRFKHRRKRTPSIAEREDRLKKFAERLREMADFIDP